MKAVSERMTSSLLPYLSPTRPQSGALIAVTVGVAPRIRPVHSVISPMSVVPSSAM